MISNYPKEFYNEVIHKIGLKNEPEYLETKKHNNNKDNNLEYHRPKNNIRMNNVISNKINFKN